MQSPFTVHPPVKPNEAGLSEERLLRLNASLRQALHKQALLAMLSGKLFKDHVQAGNQSTA